MARRTLWDVAFHSGPDEDAKSFAAVMMLFVAAVFVVILAVALAIWCWSQHWLLGLIATVCPIVGLYHTVTKEPRP